MVALFKINPRKDIGKTIRLLTTLQSGSPAAEAFHKNVPPRPDNLQWLDGIGPVAECALHAVGIKTFADFKVFTPELLSRTLYEKIGVHISAACIEKWGWIESAGAYSKPQQQRLPASTMAVFFRNMRQMLSQSAEVLPVHSPGDNPVIYLSNHAEKKQTLEDINMTTRKSSRKRKTRTSSARQKIAANKAGQTTAPAAADAQSRAQEAANDAPSPDTKEVSSQKISAAPQTANHAASPDAQPANATKSSAAAASAAPEPVAKQAFASPLADPPAPPTQMTGDAARPEPKTATKAQPQKQPAAPKLKIISANFSVFTLPKPDSTDRRQRVRASIVCQLPETAQTHPNESLTPVCFQVFARDMSSPQVHLLGQHFGDPAPRQKSYSGEIEFSAPQQNGRYQLIAVAFILNSDNQFDLHRGPALRVVS